MSAKFSTFLLLLTENNLYGEAMSNPVPLKKFRWLKKEEIDQLNFSEMSNQQRTGYIVECDLSYPSHLHDAHSSFPLAPHHLKVTEEMLSPYAKSK
jgi:hypothetical protein